MQSLAKKIKLRIGYNEIMDYKLITTYEEMDLLAGPWNALLDESASHVPFLRHEYVRAWWETLGGGEWKDAHLAVVIASDGNRVEGIAPLFYSLNREAQPALLLIGSIEVSDYLDVIARPQDLPAFTSGLFDFLDSPQVRERYPWQVLDFWNFLEDSPTLACLRDAARRRGWEFQLEQLQHCPYITLPGDWEQYLAGIDKKQRHEIRRKMRRAEETGNIAVHVVRDENEVESATETFLELMAEDSDKMGFLNPLMRAHMQKVIKCAFQGDCLHLAFLEINGQKAAVYFSFLYLNRLWVYNSGVKREFMEFSPGWVLLGNILRWANENGVTEFDFMRGDEEYKYRFGGKDRFVMRTLIRRS